MPKKNPLEIINQLSPQQALFIIRTLAESDQKLANRIAQMAVDHISEVDSQEVAAIVYKDLEALQVEDVWDSAGRTRHDYVEPQEVADEMIEHVLEPYEQDLTRYPKMNLPKQAMWLCMGILHGLYRFEHESKTEFKDWAVELPLHHALTIFGQWSTKKPSQEAIEEMQSFINNLMPRWKRYFKIS